MFLQFFIKKSFKLKAATTDQTCGPWLVCQLICIGSGGMNQMFETNKLMTLILGYCMEALWDRNQCLTTTQAINGRGFSLLIEIRCTQMCEVGQRYGEIKDWHRHGKLGDWEWLHIDAGLGGLSFLAQACQDNGSNWCSHKWILCSQLNIYKRVLPYYRLTNEFCDKRPWK